MKKYFTILLLAIFGFIAVSCSDRNDDVIMTDNDTYPVMTDITGSFTASNSYTMEVGLVNVKTTDVVLVYRQSGTDNGNIVWQLIPRTLFLDAGELDYDYDFTINDVFIKVGGTIDFSSQNSTFVSNYLTNQRFRIVLIPASAEKNSQVDYNDYYSVIKFYNIVDKK